jgi:hypothetical protein
MSDAYHNLFHSCYIANKHFNIYSSFFELNLYLNKGVTLLVDFGYFIGNSTIIEHVPDQLGILVPRKNYCDIWSLTFNHTYYL